MKRTLLNKIKLLSVVLILAISICTPSKAETNYKDISVSAIPLKINMYTINSTAFPTIMYNDVTYVMVGPLYGGYAAMLGLNVQFSENLDVVQIKTNSIDNERHSFSTDNTNDCLSHKMNIGCSINNGHLAEGYDECPQSSVYKISDDFFGMPYTELLPDIAQAKISEKEIYINDVLYNDPDYPFIECGKALYMPLSFDIGQQLGWIMNYSFETGLSIYADSHFDTSYESRNSSGFPSAVEGYTYYTVGTTVICLYGYYDHAQMISDYYPNGNFPEISINGDEFRTIELTNPSAPNEKWSCGVEAIKCPMSKMHFRPNLEYSNGILKINAVKREQSIEEKDEYIFADLTVNIAAGEILKVEPRGYSTI